MPIASENLLYYLSGGAANTNPNLSLGGARSTTNVGAGLNNLFDDVSGPESTAGMSDYRCIYFRNEDANANGLMNPVLWISSNTPSATTDIAVGVDSGGKNATATTIGNELSIPANVSFSSPSTKGTAISLPGGPYMQNDYVAIWVRRSVAALTSSATSDPATLRVEGDTV